MSSTDCGKLSWHHLTVRLLEQPFSAQHSRKGTTCSNHAGEWLSFKRPALQLETTLELHSEQGAANATGSLDHVTLFITSDARNNQLNCSLHSAREMVDLSAREMVDISAREMVDLSACDLSVRYHRFTFGSRLCATGTE